MSISEKAPSPARIEIEGADGLTLRQLVLEDAQDYFDLMDESRASFKYGEESTPAKYPDVQSVIDSIKEPEKPERTRFGIWDGGIMVGSINVTPQRPGTAEIGYWIGEKFTGKAYAQKATELLTGYCFDYLQLKTILAWVSPQNTASIRTLQNAGFHLSAEGKNQLFELNRSDIDARLS